MSLSKIRNILRSSFFKGTSDFNEIWISSTQILVDVSNYEFREIRSSQDCADTCATHTHGWTDIKPFVAFRFSCERAYKLAPEKNNLLSPQFPANQVLTHHCPYNQSNINVMKAGRLCFVAGINKLGISFSFQIKD